VCPGRADRESQHAGGDDYEPLDRHFSVFGLNKR
jgi:hypothetical protein